MTRKRISSDLQWYKYLALALAVAGVMIFALLFDSTIGSSAIIGFCVMLPVIAVIFIIAHLSKKQSSTRITCT